jgi:Flp pilus assembly protein TadD
VYTRISPKWARVLGNKCCSFYKLEKFVEALACVDKALEITPKDQSLAELRGAVLSRLDNQKESSKCEDDTLV